MTVSTEFRSVDKTPIWKARIPLKVKALFLAR